MTYRLEGSVYISFLEVIAARVLSKAEALGTKKEGKERAQKNGIRDESIVSLGNGESTTRAGFSTASPWVMGK